ncbi:MAG TPA: hypothetical protein VGM90_10280 [Kofleriaceae bacterium]|jgi:tetratricopeptide (TPR) repeat protein
MRTLVLASVVLASTIARADGPAIDVKGADALFNEALTLQATDVHAACDKFSQAYALNPNAVGILLNVALCDEKLGHTASAVANYRKARDMAVEQKSADHERAATEHLAALEGKVPHATFTFSGPAPAGVALVIDGTQIVSLTELADVPIDPGEHALSVTAPGYLPRRVSFALADGENRSVAIPGLERAVSKRGSRRTYGLITGGVGAAAVITGVTLGLVARSRYNSAIDGCDTSGPSPVCDDNHYAKATDARSLATAGTVIGVAGGAVVLVGVYLWLSAPKDNEHAERSVTLLPDISPGAAGFAAVGRF